MTKSEQSTGLGVVGVAGWRTDAPPMDGTVIYRRVMQPYRYQPYNPNSQQAKRGEAGRWQMMNEYGGWDNCPHPLGNEWSLENPFLSSAPYMTPTTNTEDAVRISDEDQNYLEEVADGAWGDDPRTRGVARDRLKALTTPEDQQ